MGSKPTRSVLEVIERSLRIGNSRKNAAMQAGITTAMLTAWLNTGKRQLADAEAKARFFDEHHDPRAEIVLVDLPPLAAFYRRVRELEAEHESSTLARLHEVADAKALQWILERRYPESWGRRALEITGRGGGPIEVNDARAALLSKILANTAEDATSDGDREPDGS